VVTKSNLLKVFNDAVLYYDNEPHVFMKKLSYLNQTC